MKMEEHKQTVGGKLEIKLPGQMSGDPYEAFALLSCELMPEETVQSYLTGAPIHRHSRGQITINLDLEVPFAEAERFMELTRQGLVKGIYFLTLAAQPTKETK